MKTVKVVSVLLFIFLFVGNSFAREINTFRFDNPDSLKRYLQVEFSLFYEDYKNKQYDDAFEHGWNVINTDPTNYLKYRPFKKMETVLWYLHDSVKTNTEEQVKALIDTTLHLYDIAGKYVPEKKGYYLAKKAFVLNKWANADPDTVIATYEEAIRLDETLPNGYRDMLGILYAKNATEENDYKLKALELYSKLSEAEPDNALWITRIENLAENMDELVEITGKSWKLDPDNTEKAWKYASMAIRAKEYELALEPLKFLIEKAPNVVNYHKQIATAYQKLDMTNDAIKEYKTLIELEPDNRDNYFNLAIIYQEMGQYSVARSYLHKASKADPNWDYPLYLEAQLYESAARNCGFEFMDKVVYLLAVNTYRKAAAMNGPHSTVAKERVKALSNSVPQKEDYFFRKLKSGDKIKIEGECYDWIGKTVIVP